MFVSTLFNMIVTHLVYLCSPLAVSLHKAMPLTHSFRKSRINCMGYFLFALHFHPPPFSSLLFAVGCWPVFCICYIHRFFYPVASVLLKEGGKGTSPISPPTSWADSISTLKSQVAGEVPSPHGSPGIWVWGYHGVTSPRIWHYCLFPCIPITSLQIVPLLNFLEFH